MLCFEQNNILHELPARNSDQSMALNKPNYVELFGLGKNIKCGFNEG